MKSITPVNIWHEGSLKEASLIDVVSSYDDLKSYATFAYRLMIAQQTPEATESIVPAVLVNSVVVNGQVFMNGQDYIDWDNSNEGAYAYVASKLNLELVSEVQP